MGLFTRQPPPAPQPTSAPRVGEDYYREILTTAGFPLTAENMLATYLMVGNMMLAKAWQFISSQNERQADAFRDAHIQPDAPSFQFNQKILDDLVDWNPGVAPYIADLPTRIRRILLEAGRGSFLASPKDRSLLNFFKNQED